MRFPLRVEAALDETRLSAEQDVLARVLRLRATCSFRRGQGVWQILLPVAVVDRRAEPPAVRPIIDPSLLFALGGVFVAALLMLAERSRRHDRRGPDAG
jgi:hypothetical protein